MIRAKFRCIKTTECWDGSKVVELAPVCRNIRQNDPNQSYNFKENEAFFSASPSGRCEINFSGKTEGNDHIFKAGDFYYIDMEPTADGGLTGWNYAESIRRSEGSGTVRFSCSAYNQKDLPKGCPTWGSLEISISGKSATMDSFGEPGVAWHVTFTHACDKTQDS